MYCELGHVLEHAAGAETPDMQNVPVPHCVFIPFEQNHPAGHVSHDVSEAGSHGLFMYWPFKQGLAVHVLKVDDPAMQNDPGGQAVFTPFKQ